MNFPETARVIYDKNPLVEVACQLSFPRLLAIDERIPSDFQTLLGADYPFVETREVVQFSFGIGNDPVPLKRILYDFVTEDRRYTITLGSDSITVSTRTYERWELFLLHIKAALNAFTKAYSSPMFTRIGLRYIDIISRRSLGLEGNKWSELIKNSALGLLAEADVNIEDVVELSAAAVLKLDQVAKVVIRTALGKSERTGDETIFVVDSDFFHEDPVKGTNDAIEICSRFNQSAGRAFRWIIHDRLHVALGPQEPG